MVYNIKVVPKHNGVNYYYFKVDNSLRKIIMNEFESYGILFISTVFRDKPNKMDHLEFTNFLF